MPIPPPTPLDWHEGTWLNAPLEIARDGSDLIVSAREGSDFWRTTSYGFVHDDGHALLRPFPVGSAVEVSFRLDYTELYDHAGVMVRCDAERWMKAAVEISDGAPQLGAVVTHGASDWSVAPVPGWVGAAVTIRVSRGADALTVRARTPDTPWRLVRLAPWPGDLATLAGPLCCAPTRAGLVVRFASWQTGPADAQLHE
jgi:regulation of enolase protein 1 (concanavalin A-like superfamily)